MSTSAGPRPFAGLRALASRAIGGRQYLAPLVLLSGALALAAGDQTVAGAVAPALKAHLGINNTELGLLVTAASIMAAASSIPFGILADRTSRVRLLAICALEWSASVTVAGLADNYTTILIAQLALGIGVGAAGPIVASLVGDVFPPGTRGKALGMIVAGEFAGAAAGLLAAGIIATWSWRTSFWVMAAAGPLLAIALVRGLAEPVRGQQRTAGGSDTVRAAHAAPAENGVIPGGGGGDDVVPTSAVPTSAVPTSAVPTNAVPTNAVPTNDLARAVRRRDIPPRARNVLDADPARRPLRWAIRHVLSIPTNVVIIVSSALCYFYVAGVQTFAIVFLRGKFDLGQSLATGLLVVIGIGVIVGILATGRRSDTLISRGHPTARLGIAAVCFFVAAVVFVPGFFTSSLLVAVPLLFVGAAGLGGVNPPLDAARLDIVHHTLWGRAESIRTFCQNLIKAGAPLLFGYLSTVLAPEAAGDNGGALGLSRAFLLLTVLFVIAGVVLLVARRAYLRDVATALESEDRTAGE